MPVAIPYGFSGPFTALVKDSPKQRDGDMLDLDDVLRFPVEAGHVYEFWAALYTFNRDSTSPGINADFVAPLGSLVFRPANTAATASGVIDVAPIGTTVAAFPPALDGETLNDSPFTPSPLLLSSDSTTADNALILGAGRDSAPPFSKAPQRLFLIAGADGDAGIGWGSLNDGDYAELSAGSALFYREVVNSRML